MSIQAFINQFDTCSQINKSDDVIDIIDFFFNITNISFDLLELNRAEGQIDRPLLKLNYIKVEQDKHLENSLEKFMNEEHQNKLVFTVFPKVSAILVNRIDGNLMEFENTLDMGKYCNKPNHKEIYVLKGVILSYSPSKNTFGLNCSNEWIMFKNEPKITREWFVINEYTANTGEGCASALIYIRKNNDNTDYSLIDDRESLTETIERRMMSLTKNQLIQSSTVQTSASLEVNRANQRKTLIKASCSIATKASVPTNDSITKKKENHVIASTNYILESNSSLIEKGIANPSHTCYLSATFQLLFHLPNEFTDTVLRLAKTEGNSNAKRLSEIIEQHRNQSVKTIDVQNFLNYNKGGQQVIDERISEDAAYYYSVLIDKLIKEEEPGKYIESLLSIKYFVKDKYSSTEAVSNLIDIPISQPTAKFEEYLDMIFDYHEKPEERDAIIKLPMFLNFDLSRPSDDDITEVIFPDDIDMDRYLRRDFKYVLEGKTKYRLFSVTARVFKGAFDHFIYYHKNEIGEWKVFNDSLIIKCREHDYYVSYGGGRHPDPKYTGCPKNYNITAKQLTYIQII